MNTAVFTHRACLDHRPPPGHAESPARLASVLSALSHLNLTEQEAPLASREALERVHAPELVTAILDELPVRTEDGGLVQIDADTFMSEGSDEAALRAAGAVIAAVDGVIAGRFRNAFCAVRPPGHHAETRQSMGFCLFNSIAIGAEHARAVHGLKRIAVVDFDVHHGNGTQDIFYSDPDTLYISTHQMPLYPGTGFAQETGVANNVLNRPLPPGSGSAAFRAIYERELLPALEAFSPDILFVSAGFDAHSDDPLANLELTEEDFAWVTRGLCGIADRVCAGRVVSALEGGYDLQALAASATAHVRALIEA